MADLRLRPRAACPSSSSAAQWRRCTRRAWCGHWSLRSATDRRVVVRRTSEHWWEDEQEFDAVGGDVLLPKMLHIVALPQPGSHAGSTDIASATRLARESLAGAGITAGFTGTQATESAETLWQALGAAGPPYFKKLRTAEAVQQLLSELLGQNWRVELDYGLQGSALVPMEHLVLVGHIDALRPTLSELAPGLWSSVATEATNASGASVVVARISVRGWNTDVQQGTAQDDVLPPLPSWRDLHPTCTCVLSLASSSL